jgi:hypothetical protein
VAIFQLVYDLEAGVRIVEGVAKCCCVRSPILGLLLNCSGDGEIKPREDGECLRFRGDRDW